MSMMNRSEWYANPEVIYNIYWVQKDRELAFLEKAKDSKMPVRNMFPLYTDLLKEYLGLKLKDPFRFKQREYNIYYSLARYRNVKMFSYNPEQRKAESREWNYKAARNMLSYDIGLDFDAKDWKIAWNEASNIKADLDLYCVPYTIKWSGSKGFHIKIPYKALPKHLLFSDEPEELNSVGVFSKAFGEIVSAVYGKKLGTGTADDYKLLTLDLGVFDTRRVWKCDYSWVCETALIALPLSDEQFKNFDPSMTKPEIVLKNGIRNRFDLERKGTPEGFKKYCYEVLGIEW